MEKTYIHGPLEGSKTLLEGGQEIIEFWYKLPGGQVSSVFGAGAEDIDNLIQLLLELKAAPAEPDSEPSPEALQEAQAAALESLAGLAAYLGLQVEVVETEPLPPPRSARE